MGPPAHRFLRPLPDPKTNTTHLRWFPAHVGLIPGGVANRNERADAVARELTHRAAPPRLSNTARAAGYDGEGDEEQGNDNEENEEEEDYEPLLEYGEILRYYKEQRRTQPPPHPGLNRHEQVLLRQLQTRTVITPALARYVCPGRFKDYMCSECASEPATLSHILQAHHHHRDEQGGGRVNTGAVRDPQCCDTPNADTADACANAECASDTCENTTSANTTPTDIPPDVVTMITSPNCAQQRQAIQRLEEALARQERTEHSDAGATHYRAHPRVRGRGCVAGGSLVARAGPLAQYPSRP